MPVELRWRNWAKDEEGITPLTNLLEPGNTSIFFNLNPPEQ